jgi:glutamine amidotransferase
MQILFESGVEHGVETRGLGLLPGAVTRLAARRIPHMGWNTVSVPEGSVLLGGLAPETRFYFVHSYAASDLGALGAVGARVTTAAHDLPFAAVVEHGPLSAAQFHPEKSSDAGFTLLSNWVSGLSSAAVR